MNDVARILSAMEHGRPYNHDEGWPCGAKPDFRGADAASRTGWTDVNAKLVVPDRGPDDLHEPPLPRLVHHGRPLPAPSAIRLGPGPRRGHRQPEDRGRAPEGAGRPGGPPRGPIG